MTLPVHWLTTAAVSTSTVVVVVEVLLALTLPAATLALLGKAASVTWADVLGVVGVLLLPTTAILALEGVVGPQVAAGVVCVLFGHVATVVDAD